MSALLSWRGGTCASHVGRRAIAAERRLLPVIQNSFQRRYMYPNLPKKRKRALRRIKPGALELLYKRPEPESTEFVATHHINGIGYRIPDIQALFSEKEIKSVVAKGEVEADIAAHPFRIFSCLVLERPPIVKPKKEHLEEYFDARREIKLHQQFPQLFKDLYVEMIKKEKDELDDNERTRPRVTQEDLDGNTHTLNRQLDKRLYLLTKRAGNNVSHWEMPWTERQKDEMLFETAERALVSRLGDTIRYAQVSCKPMGHSEVRYSEDQRKKLGKEGAQVFFNRAYYLEGNGRKHAIDKATTADFGWFTKAECKERLNPTFFANMEDLLLD